MKLSKKEIKRRTMQILKVEDKEHALWFWLGFAAGIVIGMWGAIELYLWKI